MSDTGNRGFGRMFKRVEDADSDDQFFGDDMSSANAEIDSAAQQLGAELQARIV